MTSVRPENSGGRQAGPRSFGDTAEFHAAVEQLADPLSDPLPGGRQPQQPSPYPPVPDSSGWYPQGQQQYAQPYHQPQNPPQDQQRHQPHQQPDPGMDCSPGYPQAYDGYAPAYAPQEPAAAPAPAYEPPAAYGRPEPVYEPSRGYEPAAATASSPARSDATAVLPVVDDSDAPREYSGDPGQDAGFEAEPPAPGGRAERRKAARRGGGTGRRRTGAPGTALALPGGDPPAADDLPVSRMAAKRAARAAKSSPGIIASQVTGELFITMGVLMLLFVVYQLWYTNILADEAASGATKNLQHQWDSHQTSSDAGEPNTFPEGTTFAIIYIPKLDVKAPIAEGINKDKILDKGEVGHYSGDQETAMPWNSTGNFALAGHRNTHGEPFRYINKLVPGDKVVVETSGMYYTYAITNTLPQTSPANVGVIAPVPEGSGFTGPGQYITLTTCTPEFTSEYRMIVWGKMVAEQPRSKGTPAALLGG